LSADSQKEDCGKEDLKNKGAVPKIMRISENFTEKCILKFIIKKLKNLSSYRVTHKERDVKDDGNNISLYIEFSATVTCFLPCQ